LGGQGTRIGTTDGERHDVWEDVTEVVRRLGEATGFVELTTGAARRRVVINSAHVTWVEERGG
jgi:hypothetical protein